MLRTGGGGRGRARRATADDTARRDGGGLTSIGLDVVDGCAPFVLFSVPDAQLMRKHLDGKGIAVRRVDTFVGLDGEFLRAAVRPHWPVLVDAIAESAAMSGLRKSGAVSVHCPTSSTCSMRRIRRGWRRTGIRWAWSAATRPKPSRR